MHTKLSKVLSAAILCATSVSMATAASITVPNFSFEDDVVPPSGFTSGAPASWFSSVLTVGAQLVTAPPTAFTGATGINVAYLNINSAISNAADLYTITAGDVFVLTVDVAGRADFTSSGFQIQLTNSSLTAFASTASANPADDNAFRTVTLTYTSTVADIGQGLRINLINDLGSNQTSFDNVRLDVIPEPSTSLVLISGLALLGLRRRRA